MKHRIRYDYIHQQQSFKQGLYFSVENIYHKRNYQTLRLMDPSIPPIRVAAKAYTYYKKPQQQGWQQW